MSFHVSSQCNVRKFGSSSRKQIIMYLADKASDDGSGIWCSLSAIARDTELGLSTVKRTIRIFLDERVLSRVGKKMHVSGHTVVYRINLDNVNKLDLTIKLIEQVLTQAMMDGVQIDR